MRARLGRYAVAVTGEEAELHKTLAKSNWLRTMSDHEIASLDTSAPVIQAIADFPETVQLAAALISVSGVPVPGVTRTADIRALAGLHGVEYTRHYSAMSFEAGRHRRLQAIEDRLIRSIESVPLSSLLAKTRQKHHDFVSSAIVEATHSFQGTTEFEHFVDNYYVITQIDNTGVPPASASTYDILQHLVEAHPEVVQPFAHLPAPKGSISGIENLAARTVLDTALADEIEKGPLAASLGPEARLRAERSSRQLVFLTQHQAMEQCRDASPLMAG